MLASKIQGYIETFGVPDEVKKITEYCIKKENGKVFPNETKETINAIVFYHIAKETIIIEKDQEGNVVGVVMWYNCNYDDGWEFIREWTEDRQEGDAIFIAFLFAESREILKALTLNLISVEPNVLIKKLIGIRQRRGVPVKIDLSVKYFNKLLKA